jgi:hypothetical protein
MGYATWWGTGTQVAMEVEIRCDIITFHVENTMRKSIILVTLPILGALLFTGIGKFIRAEPIENNLEAVEMPRKWWDPLAAVEMLAVVGLIVGFFFWPIALLTSVGLVLYFGGAVAAHIRTKDQNVVPSGFFTILSVILAKLHADRR